MSVIFRYYYKFIRIICISACVFATFISPALSSNNLPSGYTELEYIESTGTQWIDTGILGSNITSFKVKGYCTPNGVFNTQLIGGDGTDGGLFSFYGSRIVDTNVNWYAMDASDQALVPSSVWATTDATINSTTSQTGTIINESTGLSYEFAKFSVTTWGFTAGNLFIFGGAPIRRSPDAKISYLKLYTSAGLVFDGITAKRNSDDVLGMYDLVSKTFFTNAGTGSFIAGPVVENIHVATTKYVDTKFNPISTELNSTIGKIKKVVDNTITQADRISALHTGKQNRPDDYNASEKCPAGRNCLLVADETGTVHWYPICDADGSVEPLAWAVILESLTGNGNNSYYAGNTTTYNELGNTGYAKTLQPGSNDGVRQLNETEWAVKWNGKGVVYGTSVCNDNRGHSLGEISNIAQPENKGSNCWCKMTSVADTNGTASETSINLSVYYGEYYYSGPCALNCAGNCAYYVQYNAEVRSAIFGLSN